MNPFKYIADAHSLISQFSSKKHTDFNVEELTAVRTEAFKIQAFARLIKRAGKKSSDEGQMIRTLGDNLKLSSKFIEDSIGELLHHDEMSKHTKTNARLEEAKLRFTIVSSDFVQHLDWISKSLEMLVILDVPVLYSKGLIKELRKLEDKCDDIDPKLLEDGTHELRRLLRWAIMYFIYPTGLFKYKEKNSETNQYTKLTSVKGLKAFEVSFKNIDFLSQSVHKLGEAKDAGAVENYSKTISEINSTNSDIIKTTKGVLDALKRDKTLSKIRSELKEQI